MGYAWRNIIKRKSILELCGFNLRIERPSSSVPGVVEDSTASNVSDDSATSDSEIEHKDGSVEAEPITEENQYSRLSQVMTPLCDMPYSLQLKRKYDWTATIMKTFVARLSKYKTRNQRIPYAEIDAVMGCAIREQYRNKDEFNIRTGVDGNPKTVGFYIGKPEGGNSVCVRGTNLITLKKSHIEIAQAYEDYIRMSPLAACHDFHDGGHWRSIVVRSNTKGQHMAVVVFHPQDMRPEEIEEESNKLREYFVSGDGARCNLTSLYLQPCRHTRCTGEQAPFLLLHGEKYISEELGGCEFFISPDSFFQVNTVAAEKLYKTIIGLAHLRFSTSLLDICCGTGIISILASSKIRGAVGIESVVDGVRDARLNAQVNGVDNASFIHGRAEKKLPEVVDQLSLASDIVAVVNPGRSGVHKNVIAILKDMPQLRRIIYVSCKADNKQVMRNFVDICCDGTFNLLKIVPVDLFPHTEHTELVLVFGRTDR